VEGAGLSPPGTAAPHASTDSLVILVAAGNADEASRLATALVEERLAACVNIVPGVQSVYRWQGAVERTTEWLLVIKTARGRLTDVVACVKSLHAYTVPEVLALAVLGGSEAYLSWLMAQVGPADGQAPRSET
jgi:periplasmic divalent cation tolerance protein